MLHISKSSLFLSLRRQWRFRPYSVRGLNRWRTPGTTGSLSSRSPLFSLSLSLRNAIYYNLSLFKESLALSINPMQNCSRSLADGERATNHQIPALIHEAIQHPIPGTMLLEIRAEDRVSEICHLVSQSPNGFTRLQLRSHSATN